MNRTKLALLATTLLVLGWMVLFQGIQPASSSPLLGITITPVPTSKPTNPPPPPAPTSVPTLPPPVPVTGFIIPVTGTDQTARVDGMVNLGLVFLAAGFIAAGLAIRKK